MVIKVNAIHNLMGAVFTSPGALPASGAGLQTEGNLDLARLRLRVVAPQTAQGTAFQEDRRANARAIMERSALDVEKQAGCHIYSSLHIVLKKKFFCTTRAGKLFQPGSLFLLCSSDHLASLVILSPKFIALLHYLLEKTFLDSYNI
jgi:hypothetical protein